MPQDNEGRGRLPGVTLLLNRQWIVGTAQMQFAAGALAGVTSLLFYRDWIVDTARKFNSVV